MYELQSQGAIFQAHQLRAGEDILRSQSYQAASSNRKRAMIGENGQISPSPRMTTNSHLDLTLHLIYQVMGLQGQLVTRKDLDN
jgi:hypothetical protein